MTTPFIPYGRQSIEQSDIDAVVAVLKSDFLTQGPAVRRFEDAIVKATKAKHAVAMNSATSALHVACRALDVGPGDLVWTSAVSFVASSNCALYCGADVDFVDIEPDTFNMSVSALEEKLQAAQSAGRLPKVVIPVHLCGQSCRMDEIAVLAKRYGFAVIEDASHAIGGQYQEQPVGACVYSDICIFSFHPVKIVTTAEGGCATTQNDDLATKMDLLRSHGVTRDPALMQGEPDGPWYYEQVDLGYNYRMTDMQAALGCAQMERLDEFVAHRNALAERYDDLLSSLPLDLPHHNDDSLSAFHLYVVRPRLNEVTKSHREIFEALRAEQIGVNLHYMPIYLQPYYRGLGFKPGLCPQAEAYYARAISIPLFHEMRDTQQDRVATVLKAVLK